MIDYNLACFVSSKNVSPSPERQELVAISLEIIPWHGGKQRTYVRELVLTSLRSKAKMKMKPFNIYWVSIATITTKHVNNNHVSIMCYMNRLRHMPENSIVKRVYNELIKLFIFLT